MIFYRLICGACVAWITNWTLRRPEGAFLIEECSEMLVIGPLVGLAVGYLILANRQGLGIINGTLNGFYAGILTIVLSGIIYTSYRVAGPILYGLVDDFRAFLRILYYEADPLFESLKNLRLIGLTLGTATIVGAITEMLQWGMVKFRRDEEDEPFVG